MFANAEVETPLTTVASHGHRAHALSRNDTVTHSHERVDRFYGGNDVVGVDDGHHRAINNKSHERHLTVTRSEHGIRRRGCKVDPTVTCRIRCERRDETSQNLVRRLEWPAPGIRWARGDDESKQGREDNQPQAATSRHQSEHPSTLAPLFSRDGVPAQSVWWQRTRGRGRTGERQEKSVHSLATE